MVSIVDNEHASTVEVHAAIRHYLCIPARTRVRFQSAEMHCSAQHEPGLVWPHTRAPLTHVSLLPVRRL